MFLGDDLILDSVHACFYLHYLSVPVQYMNIIDIHMGVVGSTCFCVQLLRFSESLVLGFVADLQCYKAEALTRRNKGILCRIS
jgi:hypothetical protein